MKSRWIAQAALALAILVTGAFAFKWFSRTNSNHIVTAYSDLYYHSETPAIKKIEIIGKARIQIDFVNAPCKTWFIESEQVRLKSSELIVLLKKGVNSIRFSCVEGDLTHAHEVKIQYIPTEVYAEAGNRQVDNYQLISSSLPIVAVSQSTVEDWGQKNSEEDLLRARAILSAESDVLQNKDEEEKINALAIFLLDQLDDRRGTPSDQFQSLSALDQFEQARKGLGKVWCSNFSQIYNLFSHAAGVISREVSSVGQINNIKTSGHVFNESYVRAKGEWVFVDLTSRKWLVKNNDGKNLNSADLFQLTVLGGSAADIEAVSYNKGSNSIVQYASINRSEKIYFNRMSQLIYERPKRKPRQLVYFPQGKALH